MRPRSICSRLAVALALAVAGVSLSGCYYPVAPAVVVACPPGMHPGPHGHRCFYN